MRVCCKDLPAAERAKIVSAIDRVEALWWCWIAISAKKWYIDLGGGFKDFLSSPLLGEDVQFDSLTNIFQMGWNHQPVIVSCCISS